MTQNKTHHHLTHVTRFSLSEIREAIGEVEGFNAKLAVLITNSVGTMACAYMFACLAILSLPAALATGQLIIIVAWIAQTFLQLVLLSIIMVGQRVQSAASDSRSEKQFADTEIIVDRLNEHTDGGIKVVLDRINMLEKKIELAERVSNVEAQLPPKS